MKAEIFQKLKELIITRLKLKIGPDQISEETRFIGTDSLDLDSIDILELVVGIKRDFGVTIRDRKTAEEVFTSVGAVAIYIEERI